MRGNLSRGYEMEGNMRHRFVPIAALAVLALAVTVQAKSINQILTDFLVAGPQPVSAVFDDGDRSTIYDNDTNGNISVGDVIRAPFTISHVSHIGGLGGTVFQNTFFEISGVFHGIVSSVAVDAFGNTVINASPDPAFGTYAGDVAATGGVPYVPGTMLAIYQHADGVLPNADLGGLLGGGVANFGSTAAAEASIPTFNDGGLWGEFGILPGGPGFYQLTIKAAAGVGTSIAASAAWEAAGAGIQNSFADLAFAFDVMPGANPANQWQYLKQPTNTDISGNGGLWGADSQIAVPGIQPAFGHWAISSDAKFNLTVVPLPAAAWPALSLMGTLGVIYGVRKRRLA